MRCPGFDTPLCSVPVQDTVQDTRSKRKVWKKKKKKKGLARIIAAFHFLFFIENLVKVI